jgi:hypothetical protein
MTILSKLRTTEATLEGILADFKAAHGESEDSSIKDLFDGMIAQTEDVINKLKSRIEFIENEEPQYKEES